MDGVFYDSDSSEHAEDGEGFQEGVATGAATDALPPPSDYGKDDVGGGGDAPQHQKLKRMRGSAGGGGGGGGGSDGDGSGGGSGDGGGGGGDDEVDGGSGGALQHQKSKRRRAKNAQKRWSKGRGHNVRDDYRRSKGPG